jgi:hypothetical protein
MIAPTYISTKVAPPDPEGPAQLLLDGDWCGHGEPSFSVFDIQHGSVSHFHVRLTDDTSDNFTVSAVELSPMSFLAYDSRQHPASIYAGNPASPVFSNRFECPGCQHDLFRVAVGFEIPSDSSAPEDTSWFAMAAECVRCQWQDLLFDDETA